MFQPSTECVDSLVVVVVVVVVFAVLIVLLQCYGD